MAKSVIVLVAIGLSVSAPAAMATASFSGVETGEVLACDIQEIRSEIGTPQTRYTARGFCKRLQQRQTTPPGGSTFNNFDANATELYRFSWTSVGAFNPTTKSTFEEISAPPPRIDEVAPAGRPHGRYVREMVCDKDPWLDHTARCTAPKITATGVLTEQDKKVIGYSNQPFTAVLKLEQRQALLVAQRQFDERQAMLNRIGNQQYSTATSTTRAGATTTSVAGALGSAGSRTTSVQGATAAPTAVTPPAGTTGTNTGTISAALKLQAALDAQRGQQQGGAASAPAPTPVAAPSPNAPATQPAASTSGTATASKAGAPSSAIAAVQPSNTPAMRITSPAANSEIRQGQLRVQVATSGAVARDADVEFTNLSPAQDEKKAPTPTRVQWTVAHDQLAQGAVVPPGSGPRSSGRWQMRVRPAGAATWSDPVAFDFVALSESKGKAWGRQANELERQGLNPQPLPPKEAAQASTQIDQRALNPQPLPPKEAKKANPFERQGLNPQPLPPKEATTASTPAQRQTLNPQPLPPREPSVPTSALQR